MGLSTRTTRLLRLFIVFLITGSTGGAMAQAGILSGTVRDGITGETLPGVAVKYAPDKGMNTDADGRFSFELPFGNYDLLFSYTGYTNFSQNIELNKPVADIRVNLTPVELDEVVISADYAIGRDVPVAYSNIPLKRVEEELASRDVAQLINTVPGAYATQQGGGDGDARVTIRGFSQNNVAVLLDGVPVNDMENGWVYWSNWFGLDMVMQTTQVQRGLGASKLVIPAIGGTINLITRGIEQEGRIQLRQEAGDNGFLRTSIGYSTGRLDNGWGFTMAGSFKRGDGWADGLWTRGFFWYGKVEKSLGSHLLSLSAFGAPQEHGQRVNREAIGVFDAGLALSLGADTAGIPEYGPQYNMHVGTIRRYDVTDGVAGNASGELLNERVNYFHKPQFTLRDSWNMGDRDHLSTVAYLSIGHGGGTRLDANPNAANGYLENGSVDFQTIYDTNIGMNPPPFSGPDYNINSLVSPTERYAYNYIKSSINNHFWYGGLSTWSHRINERFNLSSGVDLRRYRGEHYREVYDLLGADYIQHSTDANTAYNVKHVGDLIDYHDESYVQWGGLFSQLEYQGTRWSGFVSVSAARTGYKRIDYYLPKVISGTDVEVGYSEDQNEPDSPWLVGDSVEYNGSVFTPDSPGLEYQQTPWIWRNGSTVKAGANWRMNEFINLFLNAGYLDKAPLFSQVFDFANQPFQNVVNEHIIAGECGLSFQRRKLAFNVNTYYTIWKNRPFPGGFSVPDPLDPVSTIQINLQGIDARHTGIEFDMAWDITRRLTLEGLASVGDWIWNSSGSFQPAYDDGTPVTTDQGDPFIIRYDAAGVHVGNAAQTQFGTMVRYEWKKGPYLKLRYTWFDRQYAEFDPVDLSGENAGRDSWQTPGYGLTEFHAGYSYTLSKIKLDFRGSILNLLNVVYISDAQNNDSFARFNSKEATFDAASAGVFTGQGRRFVVSLTLSY